MTKHDEGGLKKRKLRSGGWRRRESQSAYAFHSNPLLRRLENFGAWILVFAAALFGFGALKAILKGTGIIPAEFSAQLSSIIIPVGSFLAAVTLIGLFALFIIVAIKGGRPDVAETGEGLSEQGNGDLS